MLNYFNTNPDRGIEWDLNTSPELLEIIVKATGITIKNLPARTESGEFVLVDHSTSFKSLYRDDLDDIPDDDCISSGDVGNFFKPNQEMTQMDLAYCGIGNEPEDDDMYNNQNLLQAPKITVQNGLVVTDEICLDLDEILFSSLRNLN